MSIPFTIEQFFGVFEEYNSGIFPFQLVIFILGIWAIFSLHSGYSKKSLFIGGYLGLLWVWSGIAYHLVYFSLINPLAYVFAGLFVVQGLLIAGNTLLNKRLVFSFSCSGTREYIGYFFVIFALLYPLIGYFSEGSVSRIIALGLPCPSTILTLGFFMFTSKRFPKYLLIIPSLWAILGLSAAINFGVYQDLIMVMAAIAANIVLLRRTQINEVKSRHVGAR